MVRAKRVVPVEVLEAVVQDDKELSAGLRDPMEAAVDSGGLRDVVVLDQIDPGDRRGPAAGADGGVRRGGVSARAQAGP